MEEYLQIGVITRAHGVRGEAKVFPMTDDIGRFSELDYVLTADSPDAEELKVESVKYIKNRPILKFEGIDTIEKAELLRGTELYVRREDAIPLEEGEYFVGDLVGSDIFLEDGSHLGVLKDILQTGANGVYVIGSDEGKEILLPAVEQFILAKDVEQKRITVRVLPEV